mgnify:CR=1 FL=1|tara:strand:+ start:2335 stop:3894 length:1560 start_codon:yes stop_codon:yes gene_type:complete
MNVTHKKSSSIAVVTIFSILAPISGLALELILAAYYGSSNSIDGFRTSYLLINFGLQVFGVTLISLLVAMFAEQNIKTNLQDAWSQIFTIGFYLSPILLMFIGLVLLFPSHIVDFLGPGLRDNGGFESAKSLMKYTSSALFFMLWSSIFNSLLHSSKVFWVSSIVLLLPSLLPIIFIVQETKYFDIGPLGRGILSGYMITTVILFIGIYKLSMHNGMSLLRHIRIFSFAYFLLYLKRFAPVAFIIIISQIGAIELYRVLSTLGSGTLALTGYAWKLIAILSILPVSISTVIMPSLSTMYFSDNKIKLNLLLTKSTRMVIFLSIPLCIFVFIEQYNIVTLFFGHTFEGELLTQIARIFGALVIGIPAATTIMPLSKIALVMNDKFSMLSFPLCISVGTILFSSTAVEIGGDYALIIMFSLLTWFGAIVQMLYQSIAYKLINLQELVLYFFKITTLLLLPLSFVFLMKFNFNMAPILDLFVSGSIFLILFISISLRFKIVECNLLVDFFYRMVRLILLRKS